MNRTLSKGEQDYLKVIKLGIDDAESVPSLEKTKHNLDESIRSSEALLRSLGYGDAVENIKVVREPETKKTIIIRSFADLLKEANERYPQDIGFENIFTQEEILANRQFIDKLNEDFNSLHRLDAADYAVCSLFGLLAAAVDVALVGLPTKAGSQAGTMSNYIRSQFKQHLPADEVEHLEKLAKVPYDAALNVNNHGEPITRINVEGLSPSYHRLYSVGHDPLIGMVAGTLDTMRGTMTTIDENGRFVIQTMPVYNDRTETNFVNAVMKVIRHMKSDVTSSAGLPAPMMSVFGLFQFGNIDGKTIAEISREMYHGGYDFIHFCSMSVPVMIIELGVRISYCLKRMSEGYSLSDSLPLTINRTKRPKLGTMLFIAHSIAAAVNAGKVALIQNPLAVNYAEWAMFARYAFLQLKWALWEKPELRHRYVMGVVNDEWAAISANIDSLWNEWTDGTLVVYE